MYFGFIGSRLIFLGFVRGSIKDQFIAQRHYMDEGFTNVHQVHHWPSDAELLPYSG